MSTYVPHTPADKAEMLKAVGVQSVAELYEIPKGCAADLKLPQGKSQLETERIVSALAAKNKVFDTMFLGAGAYNHYIPPVVSELASREEFVTAYTPYQAEMSQGILQSIFEYQSMICRLTGMDASNASHYDGATATADGILMSIGHRKKAVVSDALNPEYKTVIETYCAPYGVEIIYAPLKDGKTDVKALQTLLDDEVGAVCIQQPNFYGILEDGEEIGNAAHAGGAKFIVNCYPTSLGAVKAPADYGADVACGEGQPLGLPLAFGGPYLGFLACKEALMRKLTGRIVGETEDAAGNKAYVLTLQAREQHIRREKASSSICSNEALCALTSAIYMAAVGKGGIKEIALQCASKAHYAAGEISKIKGFSLAYKGEFFNEFVIKSNVDTAEIALKLQKHGILSGLPLNKYEMLWCVTEMITKEEIDNTVSLLKEVAVC